MALCGAGNKTIIINIIIIIIIIIIVIIIIIIIIISNWIFQRHDDFNCMLLGDFRRTFL